MDLGIAGCKAIVCASSRGLGRACAHALAEAGVDVTINGRDEATLEATAEELRKMTGATIMPVAADVSSPEGQKQLLEACPEPDILVNNNGGPPFRDYLELDREAMLEGVIMNMVSPIELIQSVVEHMKQQRFGRIVNITSFSVRTPVPGLDLSSGARGGLTAFLGGVARQIASHNVTVNHMLPGFFDTDRLMALRERRAEGEGISVDQVAERMTSGIPTRRFGDPAEFGSMCAFLCSQHAAYITGQSILIDGGFFNTTI
jgi:3-oxoacyl-[acyl-carrier protein] reductase